MADTFDLQPQIESTAQNPTSATTDGVTVQAQPLSALIEADKYLAAKNARAKTFRGLRFSKLIPSGPFSDRQGTGTGYPRSFDNIGF